MKTIAGIAFIVGIGLIWFINSQLIVSTPTWAFLLTAAIMAVLLVFVGMAINGQMSGIVIDNRNRISLSKFQAVAWTLIVLASLITIAAHNLGVSSAQSPLKFEIPPELLSAMGISAASFVTAPLILSRKSDSKPAADDEKKMTAFMNDNGTAPQFNGKLFGRESAGDASWTDMLRGDEVGNFAAPDLGKIQQLSISLLLYGIYAVAVIHVLANTGNFIEGLPPLHQNFVWLLALSHVSYLSYKAAPHTRSDP